MFMISLKPIILFLCFAYTGNCHFSLFILLNGRIPDPDSIMKKKNRLMETMSSNKFVR